MQLLIIRKYAKVFDVYVRTCTYPTIPPTHVDNTDQNVLSTQASGGETVIKYFAFLLYVLVIVFMLISQVNLKYVYLFNISTMYMMYMYMYLLQTMRMYFAIVYLCVYTMYMYIQCHISCIL